MPLLSRCSDPTPKRRFRRPSLFPKCPEKSYNRASIGDSKSTKRGKSHENHPFGSSRGGKGNGRKGLNEICRIGSDIDGRHAEKRDPGRNRAGEAGRGLHGAGRTRARRPDDENRGAEAPRARLRRRIHSRWLSPDPPPGRSPEKAPREARSQTGSGGEPRPSESGSPGSIDDKENLLKPRTVRRFTT